MTAAFVDAEGVLREWLNAQTTLVGRGNPLTNGVWLTYPRSPGSGAFALLSRVGGTNDPGDNGALDYARVSFSVYASSREAAAAAAVALANTLDGISGARAVAAGSRLLSTSALSGPSWSPDGDEPRYLIDLVVLLGPTP